MTIVKEPDKLVVQDKYPDGWNYMYGQFPSCVNPIRKILKILCVVKQNRVSKIES